MGRTRARASSHGQQPKNDSNTDVSCDNASCDNASALPALLSNVDLGALLLAQVGKEALRPLRASCRVGRAAVDGWVTKLSPPPFDAADVAAGSGWWGEPAAHRWGLLARCPSVRELDLRSRTLDPEDLGLLQSITWSPALERLDLSRNNCKLLSLAAAPHPALTSLDLSWNNLTGLSLPIFKRLASGCPALVELQLASCMSDDGAAALATCEPLTRRLRLLDLRNNLLSPAALPPLAGAAWPELRELLVRGNNLGDRAAELLCRTESSAPHRCCQRPLLQKLDITPPRVNPGPYGVQNLEMVRSLEHTLHSGGERRATCMRVIARIDRGRCPQELREGWVEAEAKVVRDLHDAAALLEQVHVLLARARAAQQGQLEQQQQ